MNVKIITRHGPSNYGSLLQSIATERVIEKMGFEAEIIDYQRDDERGLGIIHSQIHSRGGNYNLFKKALYTLIRYPSEKYAQCCFDKMRSRWLKLTKRYNNIKQLQKLDADVFMTGSDQVWGPTMSGNYDSAYFLSFVNETKPKIAYAASFGKTNFESQVEEQYKQMLSRYNCIAVRENTAVRIIQSWSLNNCIGQVVDPTLLFSEQEWYDILDIREQLNSNEQNDYVLLYLIHNYPGHAVFAKRLARKMGKRLININPFLHRCISGGRFICCPALEKFMLMIKNASFIVTDSFHGTCFAINLNKQFVELLPNNGTSTRNQSLLEMTGLSDRIVKSNNDLNWEGRVIDYKPVNDILRVQRAQSLSILKSMLSVL